MDVARARVAVTGATGMLGAYICRRLLEAGARVRGVVRNPDKARFLEAEGVEFARADLADPVALREAFQGCDVVVSNAALYNLFNMRWEDNYAANCTGTENVYGAVHAAGVSRVVQISTFGLYRWRLGGAAYTEDSPIIDGTKRQGGAYRATKQLSERRAFELSEKYGLRTTALRPGGIYGARDKNLIPYCRMLMRSPILPLPKFYFPFVYAGDVARVVVNAIENDASAGHAYLIAGRNETLCDFARGFREAAGRRNWLIPISFGFGLRVDCGRAERELGFRNVPYVEGLREVFESDKQFAAAS